MKATSALGIASQPFDNKQIGMFLILAFSSMACLAVLTHASLAAGEVSIVLSPSRIILNTSSIGYVDITVVNNQDFQDTFNVVVDPPQLGGVSLVLDRYNLVTGAHSSQTARVFFTVSQDADDGSKAFDVHVTSITNGNVLTLDRITVIVQRIATVYLSGLEPDKTPLQTGDCVTIKATITNTGGTSESYRLSTVLRMASEIVKTFDDQTVVVASDSSKDVNFEQCFDRYALGGQYVVTTMLRSQTNKFLDMRTTRFNITEVEDVQYSKSVQYTPFAQIRTITVTNQGNIVERNFSVTEIVSDLAARFFNPVDPISGKQVDGDKVVYAWNIPELAPGKTTTIKYEIRFVSIWLTGVVIALIVFLAFSYAYKPRVTKKATYSGQVKKGMEIPITVELKNSTLYELRNLTLTDIIPPIASLIEKFDTIPPATRKIESGTELTWKIKNLRPLEERVVTYRIRPTMDVVGSIRLPRAYLEYFDTKNQKKTEGSDIVDMK
jgi:hypothetical protein